MKQVRVRMVRPGASATASCCPFPSPVACLTCSSTVAYSRELMKAVAACVPPLPISSRPRMGAWMFWWSPTSTGITSRACTGREGVPGPLNWRGVAGLDGKTGRRSRQAASEAKSPGRQDRGCSPSEAQAVGCSCSFCCAPGPRQPEPVLRRLWSCWGPGNCGGHGLGARKNRRSGPVAEPGGRSSCYSRS